MRLLHDLADEVTHQGGLARTKLLRLFRVLIDQPAANPLDRRNVAHLHQPELGHHILGRAIRSRDFAVDFLGLLAADRPAVDELEQPGDLRWCRGDARFETVDVHVAQNLARHEIRDPDRVAVQRRGLLEESGDPRMPRQDLGEGGTNAELAGKARPLGARQLRERCRT